MIEKKGDFEGNGKRGDNKIFNPNNSNRTKQQRI